MAWYKYLYTYVSYTSRLLTSEISLFRLHLNRFHIQNATLNLTELTVRIDSKRTSQTIHNDICTTRDEIMSLNFNRIPVNDFSLVIL